MGFDRFVGNKSGRAQRARRAAYRDVRWQPTLLNVGFDSVLLFLFIKIIKLVNVKDWSGWWESNPRYQLGKLKFCHWTTPAFIFMTPITSDGIIPYFHVLHPFGASDTLRHCSKLFQTILSNHLISLGNWSSAIELHPLLTWKPWTSSQS